ncbi:patatin-like protein 2 [Cinnamomum micranthum f. kanehirae]|uniref:Patatin n=1 Tax=Cinnamomum micranthum f. kanehirae TaxID=337451 RepID=A0A443PGX3_9MAGN|nr:patatin-like protein 2 [Cinnamomum micranthum f. kanehirae]
MEQELMVKMQDWQTIRCDCRDEHWRPYDSHVNCTNEINVPFAAKDIKDFYLEHCPKIFPQCRGPFAPAMKLFKAISGPTYNGKYLRALVEKKLGTTLLKETLTNVIIPAFDIKKLQPTIFSSREVESKPYFNALLSDICIGTSAAPTYLPAHHFKTKYSWGEEMRFDLIDGGVAANNPVTKT